MGANERDRERNLRLALEEDADYRDIRQRYRATERAVNELRVEVENALDARRREEWQQRRQLAEALLCCGLQSGGLGGEALLDRVVDLVLARLLQRGVEAGRAAGV